jgi:hypothetical protein
MAKRLIHTEIDIAAAPAAVWRVLTDFAGMSDWNPFMTSVTGALAEGARLAVTVAPPGRSAMSFTPTIQVVRPEVELRWFGSAPIPGIFNGEHFFQLAPRADGGTRFTHGEQFSGLLVGFMGAMLDATELGFKAMNAALKAKAEGSA